MELGILLHFFQCYMVQKTTEKKEKHQIKFSLYKLYSNMTLAAVVSVGQCWAVAAQCWDFARL